MRTTPAGACYYLGLLGDKLLYDLKQKYGDQKTAEIEKYYSKGNYAKAAKLVGKKLGGKKAAVNTKRFEQFTHRVGIRIDNIGSKQRDNWPIVVSLKKLRKAAKNINLDNCAVVMPNRYLDWFEIPHQVDLIDKKVGEELSFLAELPENEVVTYYVYYCPEGKRDKWFADKTQAVENRFVGDIGWESTLAGYRFYSGRMDFSGKSYYDHLWMLRLNSLVLPLPADSYHIQADWGMDALSVGASTGLGMNVCLSRIWRKKVLRESSGVSFSPGLCVQRLRL